MNNSNTRHQRFQQHKTTRPIQTYSNKSYTTKMERIYIIRHTLEVEVIQVTLTMTVATVGRIKVNLGN